MMMVWPDYDAVWQYCWHGSPHDVVAAWRGIGRHCMSVIKQVGISRTVCRRCRSAGPSTMQVLHGGGVSVAAGNCTQNVTD
jgi:hypothetical protein